MVKHNSTIFRTITDEVTGATKSIGLFGKSFGELKTILSSIKTNGIFKTSTLNESDIKIIEKYNDLINAGITDQAQLEQATKGASDSTKQMIKNANGNTIALDKMTLGAKAAGVAMKALATVGNMFLGMAISWGISKLLNLENEALSKAQKAYQNTLDEVNKVKEKEELIFSSTKELSELLKSEKWGADSAKAASQIYQNMADELERVGDVENSRIQQLRDEAKQIERNTKLSQEERDAKAEALRKEALTGWGEQKTVTTNEDLYNDAKDVFWKTVKDEFDGITGSYNSSHPLKGNVLYSSLFTSGGIIPVNPTEATSEIIYHMSPFLEVGWGGDEYVSLDKAMESLGLKSKEEAAMAFMKTFEGLKDIKNVSNDELYNSLRIVYDALSEPYHAIFDAEDAMNLSQAQRDAISYFEENGYNFKSERDKVNFKEFLSEKGHSEDVIQEILDNLINNLNFYIEDVVNNASTNKKITLSITDSIKQIADQLEPQFVKLGEAYQSIFTSDGFTKDNIDNSMLEGLRKTFTEIEEELGISFDTSALNNFFDVLTDSSSVESDVQKAFDSLATSYLNSTEILEMLNEETSESVVKQLEQLGVTNAQKIVEEKLRIQQEKEKKTIGDLNITKEDFIKHTYDTQAQLLHQYGASELCKGSLLELQVAEINLNSNGLDASGKIEQLKNLALAYGLTATEAQRMFENEQNAEELKKSGVNIGFHLTDSDYTHAYNDIIERIYEAFFKLETDVDYNGNELSKNKSSDNSPTQFDWIEVKLNNAQEVLDKTKNKIDDVYLTWSERNKALKKTITDTTNSIKLQEDAYNTYMNEASQIQFNDSEKKYLQYVQNGYMDVEDIKNKNLADRISKYQDLYEKAQKCKDAQDELNKSLNELKSLTQFELKQSQYDDIHENIENNASLVQSKIDELKTKGLLIDNDYYKQMKSIAQGRIYNLNAEKSALQNILNTSGVDKNSEAYHQMYAEIAKINIELSKATTELSEWDNTINENNWEIFDYLEDSISRITGEADYLVELLSNEDLFDDNGNFTKYADATLGLHVSNLQSYKQQALDYKEEMESLEKELANGGGQEVLDKYNERVDAHRDAINAIQKEKQAILDLVENGFQVQLEALQKLIDKKKEALSEEKALYDYQQSIAEKTSNISSLQKQYDAYKNSTSEEDIVKAQQLKVKLEEAKADLEQTEYEKMISDQEKMLDQLSSDYEQWIEQRLENSDTLLQQIIDNLSADGSINATLQEIAKKNGTFVSDELTSSISDGANSSINSYLGEIIKLLGGDDSFFGNAGSKVKGYASGIKRSGKELAWLNENGAEIIRTKDGALLKPLDNSMVFNNESSKRLWEFSQNPSAFLEKMGMNNIIQPIFNVPKLPNIERVSNQIPVNNITHMEVVLPNVTNYDDFMNRMQNDKRFDNIVTASMNSKMTGSNSLSKFRF